ncbi:MAG TPA: hypothetical protein VMT22_06730 [Terriglobales bacterium]|nr:hypothetical protein [Terriglobales bacterium]
MRPKSILAALAAVQLLACCTYAVAEKSADGIYTIKQPQSKYDLLGQDQLLATGDHESMNYQAKQACPGGYEKVREYLRRLPDRNSYYAWDIRCLK